MTAKVLLVAAKLVDPNVTVNVFEAELSPWVAITGTGPIDDGGTVKLAKKNPLVVVVTEAGVVSTANPLNVISKVESGSKPKPEISTGVPTGPEVVLRKMAGGGGSTSHRIILLRFVVLFCELAS